MKDARGCLVNVPATSLVDEEDMASRSSEFQEVNRAQKRALHEHHLSRKRCRLRMRQDIFDAFWTVYEQETWNRLNELIGSPDVTVEDVEEFALEAILSVNQRRPMVKLVELTVHRNSSLVFTRCSLLPTLFLV